MTVPDPKYNADLIRLWEWNRLHLADLLKSRPADLWENQTCNVVIEIKLHFNGIIQNSTRFEHDQRKTLSVLNKPLPTQWKRHLDWRLIKIIVNVKWLFQHSIFCYVLYFSEHQLQRIASFFMHWKFFRHSSKWQCCIGWVMLYWPAVLYMLYWTKYNDTGWCQEKILLTKINVSHKTMLLITLSRKSAYCLRWHTNTFTAVSEIVCEPMRWP